MRPPHSRAFANLIRFWRIPQPLARAWWSAVSASQHPAVRGWRLAVVVFESTPCTSVKDFLYSVCQPARVIETIEIVVTENRLSRHQGNAIEEKILECLSPDGNWAGGTYDRRRRTA